MKPIKVVFAIVLIMGLIFIAACQPKTQTGSEKAEPATAETETEESAKSEVKLSSVDKDIPESYPYPTELPDSIKGKEIFTTNCISCHGAKGDQIDDADFSSKEFIKNERPYELFEAITNGKGGMPSWKNKLSEVERWNVLYYVWTLHSSQGDRDAGLQIYGTYCVPCHGVSGNGQGSGTQGSNIKPADFTDLKWFNAQKDSFLLERIDKGVGLMPSFAEDLSAEQQSIVMDFIRTFSYGPKAETTHQ